MSKPATAAVLALDGVTRIFNQAGQKLEVLSGASLSINPGEMVALVGPSGAGKSTLLHIAGLLEPASAGTVRIDNADTSRMSDNERTRLRLRRLGFVYQFHHLLPEFTALENVMLPQMIAGAGKRTARLRAERLLKLVGLAERATHRPARLSGGEQQRVAIVRALANNPGLLLADEPTGNLDPKTATDVFEELRNIVRDAGLAALIATHNSEIAKRMDRTLTLRDGKIVDATAGTAPAPQVRTAVQ